MSKKTLPKIELQAISMLLQKYGEEKVSRRFAYAAVKNRQRMQEELDAIKEVMKPLFEYERKRIDLCKELATKDEKGEPVMDGDKYAGLEGNPEFMSRSAQLQGEYAPMADEVNNILKEDVELDFFEIDVDDLPEKMSPAEVELLMPLIKDPEQESE